MTAEDGPQIAETVADKLADVNLDTKHKEPNAKKEKKPKADKPKQGRSKEVKKETKLGLNAKKEEDFSEWYSQIVVESELISYYAVSGCYILRPTAYSIWDSIKNWFDAEIKEMGVENCYFPLFIPEEYLLKEKDHVEGFAAEVAWVTRSGNSELERPIAIRPTSETAMYKTYATWIRSHRDLPLRLNQWANVVRWEFKHPTPFIRSREFLWQEGHTAFATQPEAETEVYEVLDLYRRVYEDLLAVPVIKGKKSDNEKFAGALFTTSVEAFIPMNGRGVQGATSHCLGQNFSKMFDIEFETEVEDKKDFAWQNSWGLTTRTIGVMIMTHGDDKGLVLPPRVAHLQVVVVPIPNSKLSEEDKAAMLGKSEELYTSIKKAGIRVNKDLRENYTPGWKYNYWELRGVPIRLELGPKDMVNGVCVLARRDTGAKELVAWGDVITRLPVLLEEIQADMFTKAKATFDGCLERATKWDDFMAAIDRKHMVLAPWADEVEVEEMVKKKSASEGAMGAKTLCIPMEQPELVEGTVCFASGKPAKNWALWGRSY